MIRADAKGPRTDYPMKKRRNLNGAAPSGLGRETRGTQTPVPFSHQTHPAAPVPTNKTIEVAKAAQPETVSNTIQYALGTNGNSATIAAQKVLSNRKARIFMLVVDNEGSVDNLHLDSNVTQFELEWDGRGDLKWDPPFGNGISSDSEEKSAFSDSDLDSIRKITAKFVKHVFKESLKQTPSKGQKSGSKLGEVDPIDEDIDTAPTTQTPTSIKGGAGRPAKPITKPDSKTLANSGATAKALVDSRIGGSNPHIESISGAAGQGSKKRRYYDALETWEDVQQKWGWKEPATKRQSTKEKQLKSILKKPSSKVAGAVKDPPNIGSTPTNRVNEIRHLQSESRQPPKLPALRASQAKELAKKSPGQQFVFDLNKPQVKTSFVFDPTKSRVEDSFAGNPVGWDLDEPFDPTKSRIKDSFAERSNLWIDTGKDSWTEFEKSRQPIQVGTARSKNRGYQHLPNQNPDMVFLQRTQAYSRTAQEGHYFRACLREKVRV
ncbi:hypothetical protein ABW19_dt0200485 [Dactylella cylindrospora]|nr:hypothetical protein ABW19_dt0200485 [Dactylella cylindrospora]